MRITFDPTKRDATLMARGLDFADAAEVFAGPTIDRPDTRFADPEPRTITFGYLNERLVVVVWASTGGGRRVISMRRLTTGSNGAMGETDFAKVDAYQNTAADYEDIPDMADTDPALDRWHIGGEPVTDAEGRAAMGEVRKRRGRPPVEGGKVQLALRVDRDVVDLFKASGAGWHGRMNAALRKAVGLG